jgi:hypothetical protein
MTFALSWSLEIFLILLLATTHLRKSSGHLGKGISSGVLCLLVAGFVHGKSLHLCDEGDAPFFLLLAFGGMAGCLPWLLPRHPWWARVSVIPVILFGTWLAQAATASYHRDDITGNKDFAAGWFWHTPFSGQYSRHPEMTFKKRYAERDSLLREIEGERGVTN